MKKYKIVYVVRNWVNAIEEYDTAEEAYEAIADTSQDCDHRTCIDEFYDEYFDKFAGDLLALGMQSKGAMVIPFINEDDDYGAMIITVEED